MNEDTYNKYIVSLHKSADIDAFKKKLKNYNIRIKTQLSSAPVLVVYANEDGLQGLKQWPEVKKLEDEFRFLSLAPPSNY
jgi:hypothetical protein